MIYKLFIGLVVVLAAIYYLTIAVQIFTDNKFKVTKKNITFKAAIPFYYWIK